MEIISVILSIITIIISIVAIVISIWTACMTVKKSAQVEYKKNLYNNILQNEFQKELPQIIETTFDLNAKTANIDQLEELIGNLRVKIFIFKYVDRKFYEEMNKLMIEIDEKLVVISTRTENFIEKHEKIIELITDLYRNVEKYLFN